MVKGETCAFIAGSPPGAASNAAMAVSYGYVCRPLPAMGPWPVARTVKVGMGAADVVSVVGAAVVVMMIASMVLDVSRTIDDSLVSADESVVAVEVAEATDVAVSMVVADSIDETNDVSVGASGVAVETSRLSTMSHSSGQSCTHWACRGSHPQSQRPIGPKPHGKERQNALCVVNNCKE